MLKERVRVVGLPKKNKAAVKLERKTACSCCRLLHLCNNDKNILLIDVGKLELNIGDTLLVSLATKGALISSLIIFFLPTLIFISSLVAFRTYPEMISFLLAVLGLFVYYIALKLLLKKDWNCFKVKAIEKI